MRSRPLSSFFFFNDTATTEIYTLSLHDALPICPATGSAATMPASRSSSWSRYTRRRRRYSSKGAARSEEHTSELQSPCNLVCRLLLEKKKKHMSITILSLVTTPHTE